MPQIRRHVLLLAAAIVMLVAGIRLVPADRAPAFGWMLIVWALALVAAVLQPSSDPRARRGRSESRSG
jgi:hypothetical protein